MVGVKGAGGVPPKRSDQRRRRNTPAGGKPRVVPAGEVVEVPGANPDWHPIAVRWFESLKVSGQRVFYEGSDWLTAYAVAESMSREFKPQPLVVADEVQMFELPPKAASLTAWLKGAASLLATEGDRRRAGVELVRPRPGGEEEAGDVSWIDDARSRLREPG